MVSYPRLFIANWKMHGSPEMAKAWLPAVSDAARRQSATAKVVVCPPVTLIHLLSGGGIALGAQNCHVAEEGAFTGEISASMLKDMGCSYVIAGHSERRAQFGETNEMVKQKAQAAIAAGLTPIVCVGETLAERDAGKAQDVVAKQLKESLPQGQFVVAYEPVWAIGTGRNASPADIESMHAHIAANTPKNTQILYGGSVKAANTREILTIQGVSGVLVGGASLNADEFNKIIESSSPPNGGVR